MRNWNANTSSCRLHGGSESASTAPIGIHCCSSRNEFQPLKTYLKRNRQLTIRRAPVFEIISMKGTPNRAAVYVRVSTTEQSTRVQESELKEYVQRRGWLVHKIYRDQAISGTRSSRPALDELMADCRRRKAAIDVVLVWKFDRFARSLRQLVNAFEEFRQLGINFVSATEAIDTSLPHGEMIFQILGAIGQWERALIAERVTAGLLHARRRGTRLGRPPLRKLDTSERNELRQERQRGTTYRALASRYGVSVWTAHRLCMPKL